MHRNQTRLLFILSTILFYACNDHGSQGPISKDSSSATIHNYAFDREFLRNHSKNIIELRNETGKARLLLSGEYQGRVMTSTSNGDSGISYGWINYGLIASGEKKKQFNAVGGENRFWMGPEGGQYSIYFKAGDSFNIAHWQVPPIIDTVSYDLRQDLPTTATGATGPMQATFTKTASFSNYSGTRFDIRIDRTISLLSREQMESELHTEIPSNVNFVGYVTDNTITNTGTDWKKQSGLLSIWLLSMFTPTPQTVVVIPFHPQPDARSFITDDYFGKVPSDRLQVKDSVLYFTCDGKYRSKIGLSPMIAKPLAASYDFKNNVLTLLIPTIDKNGMYVNSKWEIQKEPYSGDVINSYNDGPLQDGSQLGPFYEVESSSSTKELKQGEKLEYREGTCHLQGDYNTLRSFAKHLLGVDLDEVKAGAVKR